LQSKSRHEIAVNRCMNAIWLYISIQLEDLNAMEFLEDNKLLGDFTENAIKKYFEKSGFEMVRFGVEHFLKQPLLDFVYDSINANWPHQYRDNVGTIQDSFTRFLRGHPDFIAIRPDFYGKGLPGIFPVEVKFRTERVFLGKGNPLHTVRLSKQHIETYSKYWPSTLVVVVCYKAKTILATRLKKLEEKPDFRVPIEAHDRRASWFYDLKQFEFHPLWSFKEDIFDADLGRKTALDIVKWADEVKTRNRLAID